MLQQKNLPRETVIEQQPEPDGTDHRAQLLRLLTDLEVKTGPQDYIFYAYDHP